MTFANGAWHSFIAVAGWAGHSTPPPSSSSPRSLGHFRSLSSIPQSPSPQPPRMPGKFLRPRSSPPCPPPQTPRLAYVRYRSRPTTKTPSSAADASGYATPHHPDLNAEVATLSTKLINAINYQTTLDDTLSATRSELDKARQQIRTLEARNATQREMLSGDVWVRKRTVEEEKKKLLAVLAVEQSQREEVEREKKKIEQELENLTTALFEEANKMVISAKEDAQRDHDMIQKKNDQLKAQLADTEALLKFQQEQLTELKHVMEQMTIEREELSVATAPSSPGFAKGPEYRDDDRLSPDSAAHHTALEPVSPTYPTSFSHLIQPVLRTDLASYEDFTALARLSNKHAAGNRHSSGSMPGANKLGSGLGGSISSAHPSNASTTSLSTAGTPVTTTAPQTPNTPASTVSVGSADAGTPVLALKETKYFKRVLTEDVEATLRLDLAPSLSWLARRSVLSAMTDGSIVVEPIPSTSPYASYIKPQFYPCSLCGDARKDESHLRTYRFRTNESDSAQHHDDAEKAAWEESVRLREQMFWARVGGGVVPTGHPVQGEAEKSPRQSHETSRKGEAATAPNAIESGDMGAEPESPGDSAAIEGGVPLDAAEETVLQPVTPSPSNRNSTQTLEIKDVTNPNGEVKRLSITIPTAEVEQTK
ncbi:conserved hypothetical protein [Verticillium alfalfae VaMs.102]|uniref:GDP/GTP exchange factor Sec2 N-terminal domain-containing protein n=1 Tax=Verticillium alfalfae (strain VaMs.102 / ATCC MYA-4576 / FGSC 10136) TaxID=526221 RepID=C9SBU2_VERA1|nr:conserved hypothetical protein [Verticillium alfalfae VaMs.102]EEY15826.1 conserved hypothetical protein [Verticillium alfalfae VaMs.102]